MSNYNPSHVQRQQFSNFWSTNKNVIGAHVDPTKIKFFGRLFWNLGGAAP